MLTDLMKETVVKKPKKKPSDFSKSGIMGTKPMTVSDAVQKLGMRS